MFHSQLKSPHKAVVGRYYLHVEAFGLLSPDLLAKLATAEKLAQVERIRHFNVAKFEESSDRVSLLNYPQFLEDGFPALRESWHIDTATGRVSYRTYDDSLNPPILHRKELMLAENHPRRAEFKALTEAAEAIDLFDGSRRIGFREQWLRLVREKGYQVVGNEFVPIANDETTSVLSEVSVGSNSIARHLTALVRHGFSAPVQALARYGFITPSVNVFDYGCGRGDDVRGLVANGISAYGWDPHYCAEEPKREADVVNLGFVINVIEDFDERVEALHGAYDLTKKLLAVSAMLTNQAAQPGAPYRDGIRTSRNTFQKYYTQAEFSEFIASVLEEEPIPVSPGVFFVFRDKDLEQSFLAARQRNATLLQRLTRTETASIQLTRSALVQRKYESNRDALESLWQTWLCLGREPDETEVDQLDCLLGAFGSLSRALRFLTELKDQKLVARSRESRMADLTAYLALGQFAKRKQYKHLEPSLKRDIRGFFRSYGNAQACARNELFKIGNPQEIARACVAAAKQGLGWLEEGRYLQLHTSMIERLPTVLRIYVVCGAFLYGDVRTSDLVKIHIDSGKLTLMKFDDFEGQPLPRLIERIKLNLRSQNVDIFQYGGEFEPPYLFFKSRYINEEYSGYPEQLAFDEKLAEFKFLNFSEHGPRPKAFCELLERHRWAVDGFDLVRTRTIPNLDDPCGRYLTYRQLIECGETQWRTHLPNLPKEADSYTALYELATNVLDPTIEYFGSIRLTYGFCSSDLARVISARIAPKLDQHAAHEKNRRGQHVCRRLGAAVDFIVEDDNMRDVVHWISKNVPFDRLYYYGAERPIHVSFAANPKREVVELVQTMNKKPVPRVWPKL